MFVNGICQRAVNERFTWNIIRNLYYFIWGVLVYPLPAAYPKRRADNAGGGALYLSGSETGNGCRGGMMPCDHKETKKFSMIDCFGEYEWCVDCGSWRERSDWDEDPEKWSEWNEPRYVQMREDIREWCERCNSYDKLPDWCDDSEQTAPCNRAFICPLKKWKNNGG